MRILSLVFLLALFLGVIMAHAGTAYADSQTITLRSATSDGKLFDGMRAEIKVAENLVHSGLTPLAYNTTSGITYTVSVSERDGMKFQKWSDGGWDFFRTINPTSDVTLTAVFLDESANSQNPPNSNNSQTQTSTNNAQTQTNSNNPQTHTSANNTQNQPNFNPQNQASANNAQTQSNFNNPQTQTSSGEPSLLPVWLKDVAKSWLNGQLNDRELISYLQRLVDDKILVPTQETKQPEKKTAKPEEGFSKIKCTQSDRYVEMIGKYTNGEKPYEVVSLRMVVLDSSGEILASGSATISDIGAHQSKYFSVVARHHLEFASCDIQVESVIQKMPSRG